MVIPAITPIAMPGVGAAAPANAAAAPGFADAIQRGLQTVSGLEAQADAITQSVASGGPAQIQDLTVATTKAQLSVDLLAAVRDRALEAYGEIMRMQV